MKVIFFHSNNKASQDMNKRLEDYKNLKAYTCQLQLRINYMKCAFYRLSFSAGLHAHCASHQKGGNSSS